jgi:NAD(P)-dependent dehydrogenase (short-subunit alcohol dehydrogenase family)
MIARRHALVLGGTGAIGSAVLRAFARAGLPTTFTYLRSEEHAKALATEHGQTAVRADLTDAAELRAAFAACKDVPDVLVHCAATRPSLSLEETTTDEVDHACAVTGRATLVAVQELARRLRAEKRAGHVVLASALDRGQSLPLPVAIAASQGMIAPLGMALAKELGPDGIRVNVVVGGPTGKGISGGLDKELLADFEKLSALRRLGRPEEIAAVIAFLALENDYMTGKTLAANGGI